MAAIVIPLLHRENEVNKGIIGSEPGTGPVHTDSVRSPPLLFLRAVS